MQRYLIEFNKLIKEKKPHFVAFFSYLALTLILFWPILPKLTSMVFGSGDAFQSLFFLWYVPYAISHHMSIYYTHLLFYPVGASLVDQTIMPLAGIIFAPVTFFNSALTYNLIFIFGFLLSSFFSFELSLYVTKNPMASFIGGIVFGFSPMHIAQAYGHLNWGSVEFIPLFLLFFLKFFDTKKLRYAAYASIAFVFLSFFGDIEQGIIVSFFSILFIILLLAFSETRKRVFSLNFLYGILAFVLLTAIISSPFLFGISKGFSQALNQTRSLSDVSHNELWSDNLLAFFVPSYYNELLFPLFSSLSSIYQIDGTERVSYLGYSVLFLSIFALYSYFRKSKENKERFQFILIALILIVAFSWMSTGPYLQSTPNGLSYVVLNQTGLKIPGPYLAYRQIPLFKIVREPGRFDVIVTLLLSMLSAIGFDELTKRIRLKKEYALTIFVILILIEYNGTPLSMKSALSLMSSTRIPQGVRELGSISGNFTTLFLPATENYFSLSPEYYPGIESYYETAIRRPIIGGYISRTNYSQNISLSTIPLVTSAAYLEEGEGLSYVSPIIENYSNLTLFWLNIYNVPFIVVLRNAYNYTDQILLLTYLTSEFGQPIFQSENISIYSTQKALENISGKSIVAYTSGIWVPGFDIFCPNPFQCDRNLSVAWFGSPERGIVVYSPSEKNSTVYFTGISLRNLTVEVNAMDKIFSLNFSTSAKEYNISLHLSKGINEILFYSPYFVNSSIGNLSVYGIYNFTIK
ncbi:MAG: hypothetical protein QXL16_02205 [Candidatus Micrarchaeaceae archaeon]